MNPTATTTPANTEQNRRELAWEFIESCDSKTLHHMLADILCGQWEKDDAAFGSWWQSFHGGDGDICPCCGDFIGPGHRCD
jgi:hypothetical protein